MNTRDRADIDGVALDYIFRCSLRIVAFRLLILSETKYARDVVYAETATDALILINPRCFSHDVFSFWVSLQALAGKVGLSPILALRVA